MAHYPAVPDHPTRRQPVPWQGNPPGHHLPGRTVGPRTGTNGPVSSGAYFGVIGRVIGTLLALFIAVGFYALAVWSGGQVVVYGLHALWGLPDNKAALAVSHILMAVIATWAAVWGYGMIARLNKWLIPTAGTLIIVGFFVYAGDFHTAALSSDYVLGGFWPTWSAAVSIATATTIGYAPYLNDGTRPISRRYGDRSVALATSLGLFIGLLVPLTFGAYTSYAIHSLDVDYVDGLIEASPTWFVVPIVLIGFFGCLGQSAICLYGNGLDLSSVVRPLRRIPATLAVSALSLVFIFLGTLVWDIESTVSAFLTVLGIAAASWIGIVTAGHLMMRGKYDTADLQVFNEGRKGGRYWYWHGWNLRATAAFVLASVVGLLQASTSIYVGPWSKVANGVDLSWLSAMGIAAARADRPLKGRRWSVGALLGLFAGEPEVEALEVVEGAGVGAGGGLGEGVQGGGGLAAGLVDQAHAYGGAHVPGGGRGRAATSRRPPRGRSDGSPL
ncbi:purine-cytosine permease family protein [Actinomadura nitritigenes]|uniref:purine-cytosine permease family protein n=1 Tax=Actinomadura nitritigenes TaxID=134602 RepID=UPI003D8C7630